MRKSLYTICFIAVLASVPSSISFGALSNPDQLYGAGAHALFAQRYSEAIAYFDKAEAQGVRDPRCFFLRGVANLRLGNAAAATADMRRGAALEWSEPFGNVNVNQALARIQGPERMKIEEARQEASAQWQQVERQRRLDRYGEVVRQERAFIQTQLAERHVGPIRPMEASEPLKLPFGAMSIDPFRRVARLTDPITWSKPRQDGTEIAEGIRAAAEEQADKPLPKPERVSTKPERDPFDDDPFGTGGDDPFGSSSTKDDFFE
jgi:hypothetical protein